MPVLNLALFDLDNTLLDGDSDYQWGQFLISKGAVDPITHQAANQQFYQDYKNGQLDIWQFLRFQLTPLTRFSRKLLDTWREEYTQEYLIPMINPYGHKLVSEHLARGDLTAVVTATNSFVVANIVREYFSIAHLIATVPACGENGEFNGEVRGTPAFREGKITRVEHWLESLGLHFSSFATSYFYSDSINDLSLLSKVTKPIAVKPDDNLRQYAIEQGWEINQFASG